MITEKYLDLVWQVHGEIVKSSLLDS